MAYTGYLECTPAAERVAETIKQAFNQTWDSMADMAVDTWRQCLGWAADVWMDSAGGQRSCLWQILRPRGSRSHATQDILSLLFSIRSEQREDTATLEDVLEAEHALPTLQRYTGQQFEAEISYGWYAQSLCSKLPWCEFVPHPPAWDLPRGKEVARSTSHMLPKACTETVQIDKLFQWRQIDLQFC